MWYDSLNEKLLWSYFEALAQIPRESGNEKAASEYLYAWAKQKGFEVKTDSVGNVIASVKATKGYEHVAPICFQAHMDMVCVKTEESKHNFLTDGIEIYVDGDMIKAKDTTLGADNGSGVAQIQALLSDETYEHGPLEGLFTVNEEVTFEGAENVTPEFIKARKYINLDCGIFGSACIGCAGGIETEGYKKVALETVDVNSSVYALEISGLLGGHSGAKIGAQRANSIALAARIFNLLPSYMLCNMAGGTKPNVIPSQCSVKFVIDKQNEDVLTSVVNKVSLEVKNEYKISDPDINIELIKLDEKVEKAISKVDSKLWMSALYLLPNGVFANNLEMKGYVQTSNNIAVVKYNEEKQELFCVSSTRSSVESLKYEIGNKSIAAFNIAGCEIKQVCEYPSWQPNLDSQLLKEVNDKFTTFTGDSLNVIITHGGLECGMVYSNIPDMDIIAMGPSSFNAHSVNECLDYKSSEKFYSFMKYYLSSLK